MLPACLHSVGWHRPDLILQIDFGPPRAQNLAGSSGRQDDKTPGRARWWLSAELLGIFSRYGDSIRVFQLPGEQSGDVGRRAWGREHVPLDLLTAELDDPARPYRWLSRSASWLLASTPPAIPLTACGRGSPRVPRRLGFRLAKYELKQVMLQISCSSVTSAMEKLFIGNAAGSLL
jgi:hypothetical protein